MQSFPWTSIISVIADILNCIANSAKSGGNNQSSNNSGEKK